MRMGRLSGFRALLIGSAVLLAGWRIASAQGSPAYSFTVDDDVPCLTNVNFQIAMHGNEGSWNDNFSVQVGATTPPTTTYNSTDVPKTIADMTTVNSVRNVADIYPITDVDVGVNITHSYDGDLVILLVPPGSAPITLVNRQGLGGDNFTNTVFDDSAATSITASQSSGRRSQRVSTRRQARSQLFVRSTGQRWRASGSRVFTRRRLPRQISRTGAPAGIGSPLRRGLLIRGSIARSRSACSSLAEA